MIPFTEIFIHHQVFDGHDPFTETYYPRNKTIITPSSSWFDSMLFCAVRVNSVPRCRGNQYRSVVSRRTAIRTQMWAWSHPGHVTHLYFNPPVICSIKTRRSVASVRRIRHHELFTIIQSTVQF